MKTKKILGMMIIIMISSIISVNAQTIKRAKKVKKAKESCWVYTYPTTTELSRDGFVPKDKLGYLKECLTLQKKRGGSYNTKTPPEMSGYVITEASYSPPNGLGLKFAGEFSFTPANTKMYAGITTSMIYNIFNMNDRFNHLRRQFMEGYAFIGIKGLQFVPLYVRYSNIPYKHETESRYNVSDDTRGLQIQRFGVGVSLQIPEIMPKICDRGYLTLLYGKTFFIEDAETYYMDRGFGISYLGLLAYYAKDFRWCTLEGTFSIGRDHLIETYPKTYFDGSFRFLVNLMPLNKETGWYFQLSSGFDFNSSNKNGAMLGIRIGRGSKK